jgi:hypothetical protein
MFGKPPKFRSAELEYEMDSYEVRAFPFARDPVGYLKMVYLNLLDRGYDEQDAVLKIIDEFAALVAAVADGNILSDDTNLSTYIYADNAYQQKDLLLI